MKIYRILFVVCVMLTCGAYSIFAQGPGVISGTVTLRTCTPWSEFPPSGFYTLSVMAVRISGTTGGFARAGKDSLIGQCCMPPRPCCPACPNPKPMRMDNGVFEVGYEIENVPPGDYRIYLAGMDSLACYTHGASGNFKVLAYANNSTTYTPTQSDSTLAKVISVRKTKFVHKKINIYYAEQP